MSMDVLQADAVSRIKARLDRALVHAGERDATAFARARAVDDIARLLAALSPRQMQILALVFVGALNKTIADRLGIGIKTVETHRARMMEKMHARSVNELVNMVTRLQENAHDR